MAAELLSAIPLAAITPFIYIGKYVAYPFKVGANIRAMELALLQLQALKKDIMNVNITDERHQVKEWTRQVNGIIQDVDAIVESYVQRCKCIWTTYNISRKAAKILPEVESLRNDVMIKEFLRGSGVPPPQNSPGVDIHYELKNGGLKFGFCYQFGRK